MDRLTTREEHPHGAEGRSRENLTGRWCRGCFEATACVEKLAEYENAEEDGRLLVLPCKPGDTVYLLHKRHTGCTYFDSNKEKWIIDEIQLDQSGIFSAMVQRRFGESMFVTREEAEQKLAENQRKRKCKT